MTCTGGHRCNHCHRMLQVKPKLPDVKIRSHRFPDATGGMDNGFSSYAVPAFCHRPGFFIFYFLFLFLLFLYHFIDPWAEPMLVTYIVSVYY